MYSPWPQPHTQRQRPALLPMFCAKRSRIQQQSLEIKVFRTTQVHGGSSSLNCVCRGILITGMLLQWSLTFLSCSLSPFLQLFSSIQQLWLPAAPGPELSLLGKTGSSSSIWQGSSFCSFPSSFLTSPINGDLFFRMHFSFFPSFS